MTSYENTHFIQEVEDMMSANDYSATTPLGTQPDGDTDDGDDTKDAAEFGV